jgi:putative ABC transport system permease protein
MRAIHRKLIRDLWLSRGPALAIALVLGGGVAMFVLLLSTFDSLELTRQQYYDRYRFADVFASLKRAPQSLAADLAAIPGVARLDTRVVVDVTLDVPDQSAPITGRLVSVPETGPPILDALALREGRAIEPGRDDEVLASETFANANHLAPGDQIGAIINGRRRDLRIVGLALSPEYVYAIRPGELIADDARFGVLWMNRRALAAAFQMEGGFNDVTIALARGASERDVIARVDALLQPYGGLGAIPRAEQLSNFFLESELTSLRGMGQILPAVFLAVAAFLLNIVLTRLVSVQREQIAALKALGYTNAEIGWHFVQWSLLVGCAGTVFGMVAGALMGRGMTRIYTDFFHFPILAYHLPAPVVVGGVAVAIGAASIGAIGAVHRIVTLPPAEAMRPEAPEKYRRTFIERSALGRWLTPPTRIILRSLQLHPVRAGLTTFGIALAGALLIVATFTIDSMDDLTDVQFNVAETYDAAVTFVEPVSAGAADSLTRLPGVMSAEPFRAVPARLRNGTRVRSVAILGLPNPSDLRRVVDASARIVTLPPDGLVLSSKLAELLGVTAGQRVTVEVLEGTRPVRDVPVIGLVDDFMGTNAYMNIDALHGLMEEGRSLSGAYLQVDSASLARLYATLKRTPAVAGVALRRAALESFQKTAAESVQITRAVSTIFATIIAFGVVYNAARIALSERSRELATLRIIGFTRGEIAYVLLGELAVITVLALPLGMAIGYGLAAATVRAFDTDVYRLPLIVTTHTYAVAALTLLVTSLASALIVRERLDHLDLIAVLKTRE